MDQTSVPVLTQDVVQETKILEKGWTHFGYKTQNGLALSRLFNPIILKEKKRFVF